MIVNRIKDIIKWSNLSVSKFAAEIGCPQPSLNHYVTGRRTKVDAKILEDIMYKYPKVSALWLLTGDGNMILDEAATLNNSDTTIADRVKKVIEWSGMSVLKFGEAIHYNSSTLNYYVSGHRSRTDANLLAKIIDTFPLISPTWLITGSGDMLMYGDNNRGKKMSIMKYAAEATADIKAAINKSDIAKRIGELVEQSGLSETKYAKTIGVSQKTFNQQIRGAREVSLETVMCILSTFKDISYLWLMFGEGGQKKEVVEAQIDDVSMKRYYEVLHKYIEALEENKTLRAKVNELELLLNEIDTNKEKEARMSG
jgi:plasmid maintenance system antidote protein VapI